MKVDIKPKIGSRPKQYESLILIQQEMNGEVIGFTQTITAQILTKQKRDTVVKNTFSMIYRMY